MQARSQKQPLAELDPDKELVRIFESQKKIKYSNHPKIKAGDIHDQRIV